MNYNNLILNELNEVVERENLCKDELLNVGNKIKQEVFGAISDSANLLSSYRYTIHLRNELSCKRKRLKKK